MTKNKWYTINNTEDIITPCLVVYPERVEENIRTMIAMAGGAQYLRPHIKTHKMAEIVRLQRKHGIDKFKCATIPEAELLGTCGAKDILLAMQPVGANIERFFKLIAAYPESTFSTIVDNREIAGQLADTAQKKNLQVRLWLDINNGMDRTGIKPGQQALELYKWMHHNPHIIAVGLHVYDGHIRDKDLSERQKICDRDFIPVLDLKKSLEEAGITVPKIVAGGSPTFPVHLERQGVDASPGTILLWDAGYAAKFREMDFLPAAVLLTRVISRPKKHLVCFDLGHKWLAPEMNLPRVSFLEVEGCQQIGQSEEHLVVRCANENRFKVGDLAYAIPIHICPTVAKYDSVLTVVAGEVTGSWKVAARNQKINI
ncbi:MAG TPA: D-TA family PLP-dependent enzyme [Arenibacter sp.]|nr:D-TA family PLP-dependent enzyme [Arenibacter sp.]